MSNIEQNIELVRTVLLVIYSEHRTEAIDELFHEDFVQHSPYAPAGGREELKQWNATIGAAMDDETTIQHIVAQDDDVAVFRTVRATVKRDLPIGVRAAGQTVEFPVAAIFRIKDAKIIAHWEIADTGPLIESAPGGDAADAPR